MKVIIAGATGAAGSEAVKHCLANEAVSEVLILARRALSDDVTNHPKAKVITHDDFSTYPDSLMDQLAGAETCLW